MRKKPKRVISLRKEMLYLLLKVKYLIKFEYFS